MQSVHSDPRTNTVESGGIKRARSEAHPGTRGNGSSKVRLTISLSEKSMEAFNEIKKWTDADTDSEVFRNALRLHLMLLRAHQNGSRLFLKDDGKEESIPVTLFVDNELNIE